MEGDGDERQCLARAAVEFEAALGAAADWPPEMKGSTEALRSRLIPHGRPEPAIARMSDETLREVSNALWRFSEAAEPCPWDEFHAQVRGIEHLREARGVLYGESGDLRDRLRAAASGFRAAVLHAGSWPEALRARAESLSSRLFHGGGTKPEEAVRRMGDKTAAEISIDLLGLCDDADGFEPEPDRLKPP